jgi:hypothetical protein
MFYSKKEKVLHVLQKCKRTILHDEEKLEFLTRIIGKKNIDGVILIDTHLEGDFQNILYPRNQLFIHHRPEKQPLQGAKGEVGVILSPELRNHWKNGESKILKGGLLAGGAMGFMSVTINLKTLNKLVKKELYLKTIV